MNKQASRIVKGSLSVILATVSIIIVGMFFNPILVRLIGKDNYGSYAILLAIFSIASPLVAFGLFNSIRKNMGDAAKTEKKKVAGGGYALSLLTSIIVLGVGMAVVMALGFLNVVEEVFYLPLLLIVLSLSLFAIYDASRSILYGLHREARAESMRTIEKLIAAMVGLILVYIGFDISGIFLGILFSLIVMVLLGYILIKDRIALSVSLLKEGFHKHKGILISFGGLTVISMLLAQALYHSDVLLIGYFLDTNDVGAYKAALVLAELLWLIPVAFQSVLLHHVSEMWSKGKTIEMEGIINGIAKYVTLAIILLGFGLLVLADPFVKLYFGPDFGDSVLPLQILILGSLGFGLARIMSPIIEGTGHIKEGIRISAGIVALNIGLNVLLIPMYGIKGAAVATSLSYFAKLLQYSYLLKKLKIRVLKNYPTKRMLVLIVAFLLLLYSTLYLPIPNGLHLFVIPPLGLGLFIVLARVLGLWRWNELRKIAAFLR